MISLEEDGRALAEIERAALRTFWLERVEKKKRNQDAIAKELGVSPATLARALAVMPITRESVERLRAALQKKGYLPCPPSP
jgi:Mg2+ and Co2+ transporter CorA